MGTRWTMITSLLAIDPGARTGWAFFVEPGGWHLGACGVCSPDEPIRAPQADLVVIETPDRAFDGIPVKSILKLSRIVGRYEERFAGHKMQNPTPRDWKGTIDGDIMTARIEAAMPAADKAVAARYTRADRHNMIDAIGLGYWALRQPFMREPRVRAAK